MSKKLPTFNEWLEMYMDEIPEDVDLMDAYNKYLAEAEDMLIIDALAGGLSHTVKQL